MMYFFAPVMLQQKVAVYPFLVDPVDRPILDQFHLLPFMVHIPVMQILYPRQRQQHNTEAMRDAVCIGQGLHQEYHITLTPRVA